MARRPQKTPAKVIGYSAEQAKLADEHRKTIARNTPGEILDAFFPAQVTVAGIDILPVDLATFMLLERVGSPLALAAASGEQSPVGFTHLAEALLLLSLPSDSATALVADRAKFDATVIAFARRVPGPEILAAGLRVREQINAAFATAIPTAPSAVKGEGSSPLDRSTAGPS